MTDATSFRILRSDHVGFSVGSLDGALRFWIAVSEQPSNGRGRWAGNFWERSPEHTERQFGWRWSPLRVRRSSCWSTAIFAESLGRLDPTIRVSPTLLFEVDDIDAALTRIAEFGWTAQGTPQPIAGGTKVGTRVMYAVGPNGETIEFMEPPR